MRGRCMSIAACSRRRFCRSSCRFLFERGGIVDRNKKEVLTGTKIECSLAKWTKWTKNRQRIIGKYEGFD